MDRADQSLELRLKQAERRAHQHWYEDGLAEAAVGVYFLLLALLFLAQERLDSPLVMAIGLPVVAIGGIFALAPIVQRLKVRFTASQAGFVQHKQSRPRRRWAVLGLGLVIGIAAGVIAGVLSVTAPGEAGAASSNDATTGLLLWLPLIQGVILAALFGLMAHRFGVARYYILGAISLFAGIAIGAAQLDLELGAAAYFTVMGVAFIISGLVTLRAFLNQPPPLQMSD